MYKIGNMGSRMPARNTNVKVMIETTSSCNDLPSHDTNMFVMTNENPTNVALD